MAQVIITMKIMPKSPEENLTKIEEGVKEHIIKFGGDIGKVEIVPVAFGLKSINVFFVMDENLGSTETLEEDISKVKGVNSVEVTDVRRAIG